jgi:predicted MFS family arabinose efflux permease
VNLALTAAILTLLASGASSGFRVAAVLLALHLKSGPVVVGLLLAAYSFLPALLAVWIGRSVDRVGPKLPILVNLGVIAFGLLLVVLWPSLPVLFVAMLLIGCASNATAITLSNSVGMASRPEERARNFTIYTSGLSASNAVGPALVGFAIDGFGFQGGFLLLFVFVAAALALFWLRLSTFPAARPKPASAEKHAAFSLLLDRNLWPVLIASCAVSTIFDGFQFIAPVWGTEIGLSASAIGVLIASFALATFTVRVVLPILSRRFREWTLIRTSITLAGLAFAAIPLAGAVGPLTAVSIVLGAAFGFGLPMVLAVAFEASPKGREAEVTGLRFALSAVVHVAVPILMGAVSGVFGLGAVAVGAAVLMFGGAWSSRRGGRK